MVAYLKYHVDNPAKEIDKPLKSANMNEVCARSSFSCPQMPMRIYEDAASTVSCRWCLNGMRTLSMWIRSSSLNSFSYELFLFLRTREPAGTFT